jgi:hypothetical protein
MGWAEACDRRRWLDRSVGEWCWFRRFRELVTCEWGGCVEQQRMGLECGLDGCDGTCFCCRPKWAAAVFKRIWNIVDK